MNRWTVGTISALALASAGCATVDGPEAIANAQAQREDCKVVTVSSTSQELRLANGRAADVNAMQQTEGQLDLGHVKLDEPRAVRNPIAPEQSLVSKALREC